MALDPQTAMMIRALQNQPTSQGLQNHAGNPTQMAGNVTRLPTAPSQPPLMPTSSQMNKAFWGSSPGSNIMRFPPEVSFPGRENIMEQNPPRMGQLNGPTQMAGNVVPMTPNTNLSADQLYDRVLQPGGMNAIGRNGGLSQMPPNVVPMSGRTMDWYMRQGYPR